MFWGIVLIVVGVLLVLNYTLGINLPIFRIVVAVGIIYIGASMLFGSFGVGMKRISTGHQAIFSKGSFSWDSTRKEKDYDTVFGDSVLDLRDLDLAGETKEFELNTVFGKTEVILKEGTPFVIESEAVFGSVKMPDRNIKGFGENRFTSPNFDANLPHVRIKTSAVFGEVEIRF